MGQSKKRAGDFPGCGVLLNGAPALTSYERCGVEETTDRRQAALFVGSSCSRLLRTSGVRIGMSAPAILPALSANSEWIPWIRPMLTHLAPMITHFGSKSTHFGPKTTHFRPKTTHFSPKLTHFVTMITRFESNLTHFAAKFTHFVS